MLTSGDEHASVGIQLLRDMRTAFGIKAKMRSVDICSALSGLEGSIWAAYHRDGRGIDPTDLYQLLRTFGIRSKDVWVENKSAKGYAADDLSDAWSRYLPR